MTTKDLAARTTPEALASYGVEVVDRGDGYRAIGFNAEAKQHLNVLSGGGIQVVQDNPVFRPEPRFVQLDPERHAYTGTAFLKRGEEFALNKQGLYLLAETMGIDIAAEEARPIPPEELGADEIGWHVTVTIRRSDGTSRVVPDSHVLNLADAREEIEAQARSLAAQHRWDEAKTRYVIEGRWQAKKKASRQISRTMAAERAIRAALGVEHVYSAQEMQRPFAGIAWVLNMGDPEVKRAAIERAFGGPTSAAASVYGPSALEAPPPHEEALPRAAAGEASQQAAGAAPSPSTAAPAVPGVDVPQEPEPSPEPEQRSFASPASAGPVPPDVEAANRSAHFRVSKGQRAGQTLREVSEARGGPGWIEWALRNYTGEPERSHVWAYAKVYHPDLYMQVDTELAAREAMAS